MSVSPQHPEATHPGLEALFSADFSVFLSGRYAVYQEVVRDALCLFVSGLRPARRAEIEHRQQHLGGDAPLALRLLELLHSSPVLHKLGQVVARNRELAPELRAQLKTLESMPPDPYETPVLKRLLERSLGDNASGLEVHEALAEGSVATVFATTSREAGEPIPAVAKVLKPDVPGRLEEELALLPEVAAFVAEACEQIGRPMAQLESTVEQVRELLLSEVDFAAEQRHLVAAANLFSQMPEIVVPEPLPGCSAAVTVMTRLFGSPVVDGRAHPRLAQRVFEAFIARPMLVAEGKALFHADPHAGNLLVTTEGKLGILDWGLTGRLFKRERIAIAELLIGGLTLDGVRIENAVRRLGRPLHEPKIEAAITAALAQVRRATLPGFRWALSLLDRLYLDSAVAFPARLELFRRALFTLEGVLADLSASFSPDRALIQAALRQVMVDWPRRLLAPPWDRRFGSQLSNLELWRLGLTGPAETWARFWWQSARGLVQFTRGWRTESL